jgi:pimeloyl-ACP methyl ester carboxylesterase
MPSVTLPGGGRLAYRESGSGAPVVLIHGSPGEGRSWSRVAAELGERYHVLLPDLPGYGGSDPLPNDTHARTAAMSAAIGVLVESCGDPVRLVGHSYGGNVALHAAILHAGRLHSLVLFEPVFFRALHLTGEEQAFLPAAHFFQAYADRATGGEPAAVSEMFDYLFGADAFARLPAAVQSYLIGAAPQNGADVRATFTEQLTVEQLAGFAKPVLVAYGDTSPSVLPAIARTLTGLMPLARQQVIPGAGHGMLDSHPVAVAELILRS